MNWKQKLRKAIAKGIKWAAPRVADAIADEVRRRVRGKDRPTVESVPWTKTGTGSK